MPTSSLISYPSVFRARSDPVNNAGHDRKETVRISDLTSIGGMKWEPGRAHARPGAHPPRDKGEAVPHIAVTLMVIFGFLGCALILRVLTAAEGTREPIRTAQQGFRAPRAMMDE